MLLDTGCTQSLIPVGLYHAISEGHKPPLKKSTASRVVRFSGETINILGIAPLSFSMANVCWVVEILIVDGPATPILGMDFLVRNGVVLDFTNRVVWSKELANGVQKTGEPEGPQVEVGN